MSLRFHSRALILPVLALASIWLPRTTSALETGMTGGGAAHENVQPSATVNYIIQTEGSFSDIGRISLFAGTFEPGGWEFADGDLLSTQDALFAVLGTTYGGNGIDNFALPDLRGRVAVHEGTGQSLTPRQRAATFGSEQATLTEMQIPSHGHPLPSVGGTTDDTGGSQPHANTQPSLVLGHAINTDGPFPSSTGTFPSPFLGEITPFAGRFDENALTFPNGQFLPVIGNGPLFVTLGGFRYGGNDAQGFRLPDLRGRTAIHEVVAQGTTNHPLGEAIGTEQVTLVEANLPAHDHTLPPTPDTTGDTGSGQPHSNMQPSLALNYIIATDSNFNFPLSTGIQDETFIGQISMFGGDFAPGGWEFVDGQVLPIQGNEALFSVLGAAYGGDGQVDFALPDLRGRTVVHEGTGDGLTTRPIRATFGSEEVTLAESQLPAHSHTYVPEPASLVSAVLGLLVLSLHARRGAIRPGSCK